MGIVTNDIYDSNVFCVKKYGQNTVKIIQMESCRKSGFEEITTTTKKGTKNTEKLSNNITRAKTNIREYALCNDWDFWCTFTINPQKYDRYHLDEYIKHFTKFIQNYNRRREEHIKYLFIPERHKDGAWHIHGFISGIEEKDIYTNKYGYFTWKQYEEKFGFISMTKLDKDIDKLASYCLKYMSKDLEKSVQDLNAHLYYCSKGLKKAEVLYKGHAILHSDWDWIHPEGFCKIKTIDLRGVDLSEILEITDV